MDTHSRNASISFGLPGIVNQPPQIFGFNADGSPAAPTLPGPIFQDHGDTGSADDNDPKRRRIARVRDAGHDGLSVEHLC
jgi:hypothetical protein